MPEIDIMRQCQLEATRLGARLFRNNVGVGWQGKIFRPTTPQKVILRPGQLLVTDPRPLHAGLAEGSSDLIGWNTVVVTPEMVGRRIAVFTSTEIKFYPNVATPDQIGWVKSVFDAGGLSGVAYSVDEFRSILQTPLLPK